MDALAQTLWLCTAVLVAAASALSAIDHVQRGYRGFQWWVGALWLNAGGAGVMALLDASNSAPPMLQSLFVPWPLLCLRGLLLKREGGDRIMSKVLTAVPRGATAPPKPASHSAITSM